LWTRSFVLKRVRNRSVRALFDALRELGVMPEDLSTVTAVTEDPPKTSIGFGSVGLVLLAILFGAVLLLTPVRGPGPNERLLPLGKSRARSFLAGKTHARFQDVAGVEIRLIIKTRRVLMTP
jgi:ATP-dependent Zn protease